MNTFRLLAAVFVLGASAVAAHAFEADFAAPPPRAIAIGEIEIGDALAAKVDEYGDRDVEQLVQILRGDLERELGRIGRLADSGAADAVLNVIIEDAMPNRPTAQQQMGATRPVDPRGTRETRSPRPLDPRSVFIGGAEVSATLVDSGGSALGNFAYEWQTRPDISRSEYAVTWTDARRTFGKFATRLADAVAAEGG